MRDHATGKSSPAPRYAAPALEKGLDIIEVLAREEEGLTLAGLAQKLGRTVSEIFRMAVTLQQRGYLQLDSGDRYRLSLKMLELAHRQQPLRSLVSLALPLMRELANRAHQSCHLATYHDGQIIVVAQVDSPGALSFGPKVGALGSLTGTASGNLLLAFRDEAERTRMLAAAIRLHGTLDVDPAQLLRQGEAARADGQLTWPSRRVRGVTDIASPVLERTGHAVASLSVPFLERLDLPQGPAAPEVAVQVREIAERLSALLHYSGYNNVS